MIGARYNFTGDELDFPLIFSGGFHNLNYSQRLEEHSHPQGPEVTYVMKGNAGWRLEDGTVLRQHGGTLAITRPETRHQGEAEIISPCWLFWYVLDLRDAKKATHNTPFSPADIENMKQTFLGAGNRVCASSPILDTSFSELLTLLKPSRNDDIWRKADLRAVLSKIVLHSARCLAADNNAASTGIFAGVRDYMLKKLDCNIGVGELAEHCGLSSSQFSRRFKRETGLTPADYLQRLRVEQAQKLLLKPYSNITSVAFDLGFSSSQYFSAIFKKYTGKTPRQFKSEN